MFSSQSKKNGTILASLVLLCANVFNLDKAKVMYSGKAPFSLSWFGDPASPGFRTVKNQEKTSGVTIRRLIAGSL